MAEFIKINLTKQMKKDYEECTRMMDKEGKEKDCDGCSLNGGPGLGCLGEHPWC